MSAFILAAREAVVDKTPFKCWFDYLHNGLVHYPINHASFVNLPLLRVTNSERLVLPMLVASLEQLIS
jgi:hypothetical protein